MEHERAWKVTGWMAVYIFYLPWLIGWVEIVRLLWRWLP